MKKKYYAILILVLFFFIFRNTIFYHLFSYKKIIYVQDSIKTKNCFIKKISNLDDLITESLKQTNKLSFAYKNDLKNNKANCVGYANLFQCHFNSLSDYNNLPYKAYHVRGTIFFICLNINKLFTNSFFKDHDYIEIQDIKTKKFYYIDPSLYDYTAIKDIKNYQD